MVVEKHEIGKDGYTEEITLFLDETDHEHDLNDRYEDELKDKLFQQKLAAQDGDGTDEKDDVPNPWDDKRLASKSPEEILLAEPEQVNPQIIRDIYQMAADGKSVRDISIILQERNLSIPGQYLRTGHLYQEEGDEVHIWHVGTISNILRSQAYIGNLVQGRRRARLCDNEPRHFTDKSEWLITEGTHEPIVSRELYDRVRALFEKKVEESSFSSDRGKDIEKQDDRYADLLYCGNCGSNIMEKLLDHIVLEAMKKQITLFTNKGMTVEFCEEAFAEKLKPLEEKVVKAEQAVRQQEYKDFETHEKFGIGEISRAELEKLQAASEKKINKLRAAFADAQDRYASRKKEQADFLQGLKALYRVNGKASLDRETLVTLIDRIKLYPTGDVEITWNFKKGFKPVTEKHKKGAKNL